MNKSTSQQLGLTALTSLASIFGFLNIFSGIIGGLWLIVLGGWYLVLQGFIYALVMPYIYTIVSLPSMGLMYSALKSLDSTKRVPTIRLYIGGFLQDFVLILWILLVFQYFVSFWSKFPMIPLLLAGYSTAISPLTSMAQHEGKDPGFGTFIGVFLSQLLFVFLSIHLLLGISSELRVLFIFLALFITPVFPIYLIKKMYETPIICKNCEEKNIIGSNFCSKCGLALNN